MDIFIEEEIDNEHGSRVPIYSAKNLDIKIGDALVKRDTEQGTQMVMRFAEGIPQNIPYYVSHYNYLWSMQGKGKTLIAMAITSSYFE